MHPRLDMLRRLVGLYTAIEEMHAVEMERMLASVRETQQAMVAERESAISAHRQGRDALITGDQTEWRVSERRCDGAGWRHRRLEQVRIERSDLSDAAREQYVASRQRREQIARVLEDLAETLVVEQGRRSQAVTDDRFLARRRWTDARKQARDMEEINDHTFDGKDFGTQRANSKAERQRLSETVGSIHEG